MGDHFHSGMNITLIAANCHFATKKQHHLVAAELETQPGEGQAAMGISW